MRFMLAIVMTLPSLCMISLLKCIHGLSCLFLESRLSNAESTCKLLMHLKANIQFTSSFDCAPYDVTWPLSHHMCQALASPIIFFFSKVPL